MHFSRVMTIYDLYMKDGITIDDYRPRNRSLTERKKEIEAALPKLQAELDVMKVSYLSRDEIVHEAQDLYSRFSSLKEDEKRRIVESITDRIVVGRDEIELKLLYQPHFLKSGQKATHSHGFIAATIWQRDG